MFEYIFFKRVWFFGKISNSKHLEMEGILYNCLAISTLTFDVYGLGFFLEFKPTSMCNISTPGLETKSK